MRHRLPETRRGGERARRGRRPVGFEVLEGRQLPATFTVLSTADAGPDSLRQAILDANASPGPDRIVFQIPGEGPHTITPASALVVSDPVTIDGYTQPGSRRNTRPLTFGSDGVVDDDIAVGSDAVPAIELRGDAAPAGVDGLLITAGTTTVRGLVINRFRGAGIHLMTGGDNRIEGNFLGTDVSGTTPAPNGSDGVFIDGSSNNIVGGAATAATNVISGNSGNGVVVDGLVEDATGNRIQGNIIGLDADEAFDPNNPLGNASYGVAIQEASANTIADNVIAASGFSGIVVFGGPADLPADSPRRATGNVLRGNLVGTNAFGQRGLANRADGITIFQASFNVIGGTTDAERNVVSGNLVSGVALEGNTATGNLVVGNYIGTDPTGLGTLDNNFDGVFVFNSAGNTIGGTAPGARNVIGRNRIGISIQTDEERFGDFGEGFSDRNVVQGNFIGTTKDGNAVLDNAQEGVLIVKASFNLIGGTAPGSGNLISGNLTNGVRIAGSDAEERGRTPPVDIPARGNVVQGNLIGTNAAGLSSLGNRQAGIVLVDAVENTIGGTTPRARNVISGNGNSGIQITGLVRAGNLVQGNLIGTDASGTGPLGNGGDGVLIDADTTGAASGNTIGGTTPGERNVISANRASGVTLLRGTAGHLLRGNFIGTAADGLAPLGNNLAGVFLALAARGNSIGGADSGAGNVIAGNSIGVLLNSPGTAGNLIQGNRIGTDVTGARGLGNAAFGLLLLDGPTDNLIGGTAPGSGNLISANGIGLSIAGADSHGNAVLGNSIGTDAAGSASLGNRQDGVLVNNAPSNAIGGTEPGAGNLISGNLGPGLHLFGPRAQFNLVRGNRIGTDRRGTAALGNFLDGVLLDGATDNTVGGAEPGAGNLISGNGGSGVQFLGPTTRRNALLGNLVGTDANGSLAVGNAASGVFLNGAPGNTIGGTMASAPNVISGNRQDGIRIFGLLLLDGPTGNTVVVGNFIGTSAAGDAALGNGRAGILIERAATADAPGVTIGGPDIRARNLISANASAGVLIAADAPRGNVVSGNRIGTDVDGTRALGNLIGVFIAGAPGGASGATPPGSGNLIANNLISGNLTAGVQFLGAPSNRVEGNIIGTDRLGVRPLPQMQGVLVSDAPGNTIGGTTAAQRNVLSGNGVGVEIAGAAARFNRVLGNYIGTDAGGTAAVGNVFGVLIRGASDNEVGGPESRAGNVISGNDLVDGRQVSPQDPRRPVRDRNPNPRAVSVGVFLLGPNASGNLVQGNLIGLDRDGLAPLGNANGIFLQGAAANTIRENVISANRSVGVYVLGPGAMGNVIQANGIGTAGDRGRRAPRRLGNIRYGVLLVNAARNGTGLQVSRANVIRGSRIANFREFTGATAPA
jgi:parallel beta-helix repeat protein